VPFAVDDRPILLVDDVLFTGRTIRAAMNEIFDYGRPARIDLAVLVDRGERQLPISATWSGTSLAVPQGRLLRLVRNDEGRLSLRLSEAKAA
jgi:pyrimidine operon attenuation protein/uracil phosphoribosyltransferase